MPTLLPGNLKSKNRNRKQSMSKIKLSDLKTKRYNGITVDDSRLYRFTVSANNFIKHN
jgi:hypothetical protein